MRFMLVAPALAGMLILAGCQSDEGPGPRPVAMASGGPVSMKNATPSSGVVLGGLLGTEPGKSLDRDALAFIDKQTNRALESAPTNQTSTWTNPDGKSQAAVTPMRTYQDPNGTYCRDYSQSITADGKEQTARGTACRRSDGSWQATNGRVGAVERRRRRHSGRLA